MGMSKADFFADNDVYIEYDHEEVMFRWDSENKKIYKKFMDENIEYEAKHDSKLFNDATLFGEEITKDRYFKHKS